MSRRRGQSDSSNVSLFPFLAVLLCTMGSLIVILVVLAHQARLDAAQAVVEESSSENEQIAQRREALDWRIEHLAQSRQKTAADLERDQRELSHLEQYLRKLQHRLDRLAAEAKDLKQAGEKTAQQQAQSEAELEQLRRQIATATEQLATAQERARNRPTSYSVVPYEGPNGTRRQPVFIECRANAVVLQPEGIVLESRDFEPPLGPGNPLAAALRATREYLASTGQSTNPYPLLLVRPGGIAAYYKAREAIESWGPDFGYELIGGEWKLDFPPADPSLAKILDHAVDQGRMYQDRLALAAPSQYGQRRPTYRASPHRGGVIRTDGNGGLSDRRSGGNSKGNSRRSSTSGEFGEPGSRSNGSENQASGQNQGSPSNGSENQASGQNGGSSGGGQGDPRFAGPAGSAAGSTGQAQGSPSSLGRPSGSASGQGTSSQGTSQGSPQESAQSERMAPQKRMRSSSSQFGSPSRGQQGQRDNNWGLPDSGGGSVAVRRTVRVICRTDRLIIMHEDGLRPSKVIALGPRTNDSIDEFVSSLWDHMKGWGIAGNGLHWQPVLRLQVGPQGAGRVADLKTLLDRSGLEVHQEGTP